MRFGVHLVLVAIGLAVLLTAGGGGRSGGSPVTTPSLAAHVAQSQAPSCPSPGVTTLEGGLVRMPSGTTPGATPLLVVVIPGGDGDPADDLAVGAAANRQGIAALYPTEDEGPFWQLNDDFGISDVTAVANLLEQQLATGCFDRDRVSITGLSNGAGFAARMACKLPTTFAAVAPVAGGYKALDACPVNARASFLAIHGTADTIVPFNGKKPDRKGNVPRYTARWAKRDGCSPTPRTSSPRRFVTRVTYTGCAGGTRVELLRLSGTDHGWPGAAPPWPQHNPSGLSATSEILRFIRHARRPAP